MSVIFVFHINCFQSVLQLRYKFCNALTSKTTFKNVHLKIVRFISKYNIFPSSRFLLNKKTCVATAFVWATAQRGKKVVLSVVGFCFLFLNRGSRHLWSKGVSCCFSPRRKTWLCIRTQQTSLLTSEESCHTPLWCDWQWGNRQKFNGAV